MTVITLSELVILLFIFTGILLSLVTTIGFITLPDLYTRTHAASKSSTLGVLLILVGVFLYFWFETKQINPQLILGIIFIFITGPVAGHLIGRAAYHTGVPLWKNSVHDALKQKQDSKE